MRLRALSRVGREERSKTRIPATPGPIRVSCGRSIRGPRERHECAVRGGLCVCATQTILCKYAGERDRYVRPPRILLIKDC